MKEVIKQAAEDIVAYESLRSRDGISGFKNEYGKYTLWTDYSVEIGDDLLISIEVAYLCTENYNRDVTGFLQEQINLILL